MAEQDGCQLLAAVTLVADHDMRWVKFRMRSPIIQGAITIRPYDWMAIGRG
jgi:hypothetical protein